MKWETFGEVLCCFLGGGFGGKSQTTFVRLSEVGMRLIDLDKHGGCNPLRAAYCFKSMYYVLGRHQPHRDGTMHECSPDELLSMGDDILH